MDSVLGITIDNITMRICIGVAIIPSSLKDGYAMDVKFIELKDIKQKAVLSAMWHKNNRNPILQKVLELL